ncbi:MAG: hypothetical protein U0744_06515 [Gemmataceae bacterium]
MTRFEGRWFTTYGPMDLTQEGNVVRGSYTYRGVPCSIQGTVTGNRLDFEYQDSEHGVGWFEQTRPGKFAGRWKADAMGHWMDWVGHRGFDGVWESSFGRLRLTQEADRIVGFYEGAGPSTIEGKMEGDRFVFRYQEPTVGGEGWFALTDEGDAFAGEWKPDGGMSFGPWNGKRAKAASGTTWVLVLEAHWQRSLNENEYSYGRMVEQVFSRLPGVAVRHRFFDDEASLERWCRELLYFPEPAIVMIASHGTPEGLNVRGRTIDTKKVVDSLRHAENLKLLHFSSCLVMKENENGDFLKRIQAKAPFPISGYTTAVDWGASAVLEFQYLDMMLSKGLTPQQAAEHLPRILKYAGDTAPPGSPYGPAGFRFVSPHAEEPTLAPSPLPEFAPDDLSSLGRIFC